MPGCKSGFLAEATEYRVRFTAQSSFTLPSCCRSSFLLSFLLGACWVVNQASLPSQLSTGSASLHRVHSLFPLALALLSLSFLLEACWAVDQVSLPSQLSTGSASLHRVLSLFPLALALLSPSFLLEACWIGNQGSFPSQLSTGSASLHRVLSLFPLALALLSLSFLPSFCRVSQCLLRAPSIYGTLYVCPTLCPRAIFKGVQCPAGDQAGYIVAWSTKLAMYPRIWK